MQQPLLVGSLSLLLLSGCTAVEPAPGPGPDPQPPSSPPEETLFEERAEAAGILYDPSYELTGGRGAAVADVNDDGWPDLYLAGSRSDIGAPSKLLLNQGDGTFLDATEEWGLDHWVIQTFDLPSALFADIDNDGDPDLLQASIGKDRVYLNEGSGFVDTGSDALLPRHNTWAAALSLADFNGDALLDVYVSEHIYFMKSDPLAQPPPADRLLAGTGSGTFIDRTEWLGAPETPGAALGAVWSDFDEDGDIDLYTINDHGGFWLPNQLFLNEGASDTGWDFTNASEGSGSDLAISGMGAAVGDINNDLHTDLYITNLAEVGAEVLLLGQGDGSFVDVSISSGAQAGDLEERQSSWGADFIDFDNDGWLDLFVAFGGTPEGVDLPYVEPARNVALRNHEGVFVEAADSGLDGISRPSQGTAYLDYDLDGCLDLLVMNLTGQPELYRNRCASSNSWIGFLLEGRESNRDGIGARVDVHFGAEVRRGEPFAGSNSHASSSWKRVHFGLGPDVGSLDLVEVSWPSGQIDTYQDVGAGSYYRLTEGEGLEEL